MGLNVVLLQPEIPQNAGNIARTCACTGATLHLVEPMGFRLTEKNVKRAGLDYWDQLEIVRYTCNEDFFERTSGSEYHLFTGQADRNFHEVDYGNDPYLIFGRESKGIDEEVLTRYSDRCVRIPMREGLRSLNLSNAVAVGVYEVLAGWGFAGLS